MDVLERGNISLHYERGKKKPFLFSFIFTANAISRPMQDKVAH